MFSSTNLTRKNCVQTSNNCYFFTTITTTTTPTLLPTATMFVIALPARFYATRAVTYADAEQLQNRLYHEHDIELPVKSVQGLLGCRCSVHIYNELHEYERLGDIINDIANELDQ